MHAVTVIGQSVGDDLGQRRCISAGLYTLSSRREEVSHEARSFLKPLRLLAWQPPRVLASPLTILVGDLTAMGMAGSPLGVEVSTYNRLLVWYPIMSRHCRYLSTAVPVVGSPSGLACSHGCSTTERLIISCLCSSRRSKGHSSALGRLWTSGRSRCSKKRQNQETVLMVSLGREGI
ncbi:hypothetical protein P168DRAFT_57375 [Aspergillus campestris IBT 28561]|uniref:Uncharacterized protein n=1 Tax=Aspergillus campestris (strain IBT 28561) TaxID=1392248 RepID=A0A2I1CTN7_ASPC2|nr:uncharacterized protein P168DRAFT_57375 [Aspergillus campestris IBT 28561]PKY00996.1 hypothetical protein P168DRAFT_57375 [Aspergillus campestris IBT 28561]